jgi:hypothetical protein
MQPRLKRRLAVGAAGLALVGGAGGAYAAGKSSGDPQRQAFLADVAKRLDVSPQQLQDALRGAAADRLQAAVKAGRLTQAQADQIQQRRGARALFLGPRLHRFGGMRGARGGPFRAIFDAAAGYVGLTSAQLRDQLRVGKSLAQVATAQSKTVEGLKQAIRDAVDAQLQANLDALVNRTRVMPPAGP